MDFSPYKLDWSEEEIKALGTDPEEIIKAAKSVRRALTKLGKLGFHIYITTSHMSIMGGPTHSGFGEQPQYDNVIADIRIDDCMLYDVGDW